MSSAIRCNLDQSKILSSENVLCNDRDLSCAYLDASANASI